MNIYVYIYYIVYFSIISCPRWTQLDVSLSMAYLLMQWISHVSVTSAGCHSTAMMSRVVLIAYKTIYSSTWSSVKPLTVGVVLTPKNTLLIDSSPLYRKSSKRVRELLGNYVRCSTEPLHTCQWQFSHEDGGGLPVDYTKIDLCTNGKNNRFPPSITYDSESKISVSKRLLLGLGNPRRSKRYFHWGWQETLSWPWVSTTAWTSASHPKKDV